MFDAMSVTAYIVGIVVLYVACLFFIKPMKVIFRILLNCIFGAVMLWCINFVGGFFGIQMGINPFTAAVAGIMGIPGLALLYVIKIFL